RDSAGFSPDFAPGAQHRQRYQARNPDIPPPHTQPTAPRRRRTPTSTPPGRSDGLPRETVTAAQDDLRALGRSTADRSAAGPDLPDVLTTDLGQARNIDMVNAAAVIGVGGSTGAPRYWLRRPAGQCESGRVRRRALEVPAYGRCGAGVSRVRVDGRRRSWRSEG